MSKQHYRVVRAFGPWSKGHVFTEMQGNEARTRIARGQIEPVQQEEVGDRPRKTKGMRSPADRMMHSPVNKG